MIYDDLKLDNQLCHRLYIASNAIIRAYRPLLAELDLTYPQYVVMMALWEKDQLPIHALIQTTLIDGGALSLILKKLVAKEYISVIPAPEDKRLRYVHLTDKGQKLQEQAKYIPDQLKCQITHFSQQDMSDLIRLLDQMTSDLIDT